MNHSAAIRELFFQTFHQPMSEELWEWKYGGNRGESVIAWKNNRLIAHYGGMARHILWQGDEFQAIQIGDVMVAPKERGILTRKGAFHSCASEFLEKYIGFNAPYLLGFGFPNQRAMLIAERYKFYASVGQMVEIKWSLSDINRSPRHFFKHTNTELALKDKALLNGLWERMKPDFKKNIICSRDWNRIHYRYLTHPEKRYDMPLFYHPVTGSLIGLAVLHQQTDDRALLLDIIAPLDHFPELITNICYFAMQRGIRYLNAWISEVHAGHFTQGDCPGTVYSLDISIPTNIWTPGPSPASLYDRWWLTAGDTDFL